jgi:hypothetical protein
VNGSDVDSRRVRELDRSVLVARLELVLGCVEVMSMAGRAVVSLSTGLEDPEKVTVAFPVAVGAAGSGRPTLMFLTEEAVRVPMWEWIGDEGATTFSY